jgi:hypothetical protein
VARYGTLVVRAAYNSLMDERDRRTMKDRRRVPRGGRRKSDQVTVQALQRQLEALRLELRTLIAEVKELKDKSR